MRYYPSRNARTRKMVFRNHKTPVYLLLNLWLIYLIVLCSSFISDGTYSYYNDTEQIDFSISTLANFCEDPDYAIKYSEVCDCQDLVPVNNSLDSKGKQNPIDFVPIYLNIPESPDVNEILKNIPIDDKGNQVNNQASNESDVTTVPEQTDTNESEINEILIDTLV